ncbi:MAG: DUF362 domain-containing protein [Bacteroidetes bacterium]|nr:DUF362 domain-containing protein [Bacteroidota bacterium]
MKQSEPKVSRRVFLSRVGISSAGLLLAPTFARHSGLAFGGPKEPSFVTKVGVTEATTYDRTVIKQKVQHLFESIGGIQDIVKTDDKVGIKINLTGGSGSASSSKLGGYSITESMWTHPEVVRAVGELMIDCGVSGSDITILEALWDTSSYFNFGYLTVQQSLGAGMVNLNAKAPYAAYVTRSVGAKKYYYDSFSVNQILSDINVLVSIPKMKEHYEAAVTGSVKNLVGMVPKDLYVLPADNGRRGALHGQGGPSSTHLPRSIADLFMARPIHLAVIDGIMNARGGEGVWNNTFQLAQDHVLLAGKDPVATDSVSAILMGHDPAAATLTKPDGQQCDNHLALLYQQGMGTNQIGEIELVGDGAHLVTSVPGPAEFQTPAGFDLYPNFPNPFNPSTTFRFTLPVDAAVRITVYAPNGQEVDSLIDGWMPQGVHEVRWTPGGIASGVYLCTMRAGDFRESIKMIYQK